MHANVTVDVTEQLGAEQIDAVATEEANRAFHQALLLRCESRWLLNMVGMLTDHCGRYRFLSLRVRGGSERIVEEHKAIYEACMRHDVEGAALFLEQHIRGTLEGITVYLQAYEQ